MKKKQSMLDAVNAGISEANRLADGTFDGVLGSLPSGSSQLLADILAYLRWYLLTERKLREPQVRALLSKSVPPIHKPGQGLRSVPRNCDDPGIGLAIGILNSIASALKLENRSVKINGREYSGADAVALLLGGRDGLRGMKVRLGGAHRGSDTRMSAQAVDDLHREMQRAINEEASSHPDEGFKKLAERVAARFSCNERTIRRNTKKPRRLS